MRCQRWSSLACASLGFFAAAVNAQSNLEDLGSLLSSQKNLSTFYGLIQKYPQVLLQIPSSGGVTLVVPSNDAFDKLPFSSLKTAFDNNDVDVITNVLEYHILPGVHTAKSLTPGVPLFVHSLLSNSSYTNVTGGQVVETIKQGGDVVVYVSGSGSRSTLTQADQLFNGGVVQVIDTMLLPPTNLTTTADAFNLTSFEGALYTTNSLDSLSSQKDITVFVPNNEAFQALGPAITELTVDDLTKVVDYHIIPDLVVYSANLTNGSIFNSEQGTKLKITHINNNVYVNSAQVLQSDILIENGVLHIIDNVLNWQVTTAVPNATIPTQSPVFPSASPVGNIPFTAAFPCSSNCPTPPPSSTPGSSSTTTSSASNQAFRTSTSKGIAVAQPTGVGAAHVGGIMVALGVGLMI
ncbi:FAS1 domain-containing protein [Xylogone sp. PMI_703]|nr:FAS1 domain-containing protein [Xylogone sp. PMI_703]